MRVRHLPTLRGLGWLTFSGFVVSVIGYAVIRSKSPDLAGIGAILLVAPLAAMVGFYGGVLLIALHEMGHVLFGTLVGLELNRMQIGRLAWIREHGSVHFREVDSSWLRGYVRMNFPKNKQDRWRYLILLLGGPIVQICLALAGIIWVARNETEAQADHGGLIGATLFLGILAIAPLIPYRDGQFHSDGTMLRYALKEWPRLLRSLSAGRLLEQLRQGAAASELDDEDLQALLKGPPGEDYHPMGLLLESQRRAESDDIDGAEKLLSEALELAGPTSGWFQPVRVTAAMFFSYFRNEAVRAQDFLSSVAPENFPFSYNLALASTRLAQGRASEAHEAALKAMEYANDPLCPDPASPLERRILSDVCQLARSQVRSAAL